MMSLGAHLRTLARLRLGLAVSVLVALLAALWSVDKISLFPPGLKSRSLEVATASTSVVVDTQTSAIVDLRQSTYDIEALNHRAVLVGTIMNSAPVREYIARRAQVPPEVLHIVTPRTPGQPRPRLNAGDKEHARDILKAGGEYRLDVEASATVPILNLYTQAPSTETAEKIADAAVEGARAYLAEVARSRSTAQGTQVRLEQLGPARGGLINEGVGLQLAIVSFIVVLGASSIAVLCLDRIRQGWSMAADPERAAAA